MKENEHKMEGLEEAQGVEMDEKAIIDRIEDQYLKMIQNIKQEKEDEDKENENKKI